MAASSSVTTAAVDNGTSYNLSARAVDQAGNSGSPVSTTVLVDRVRPTAAFSIANMARLTPTQLDVTFSEPMAAATAPIALTPTAASTLSGTVATATGLGNYTAYTAAVNAALTDARGNPVVAPSPIRFFTEVRLPVGGSIIASNVLTFDVVADQDGAPLFAIRDNSGATGALRIVAYNPQTAALSTSNLLTEPNFDMGSRDFDLQAFRAVNADLTPTVRHGGSFTQANNASRRVIFAFENGSPMAGASGFSDHTGLVSVQGRGQRSVGGMSTISRRTEGSGVVGLGVIYVLSVRPTRPAHRRA